MNYVRVIYLEGFVSMKWQCWQETLRTAKSLNAEHGGAGEFAPAPQREEEEEEQKLLRTLFGQRRFVVLQQLLLYHWQKAVVDDQVVRTFWSLLTPSSDAWGIQKPSHERHPVAWWMQQLALALEFVQKHFTPWQQLAQALDHHVRHAASSSNDGDRTMQQHKQEQFPAFESAICTKLRCLVFAEVQHKQLFQELFVVVGSVALASFRESEPAAGYSTELFRFRDQLMELQWMDLVQGSIRRVVSAEVRKSIRCICGEIYDESFYDQVEEAVSVELWTWLENLLASETLASTWSKDLQRHALEEFGRLRICQLFEIIKEFPDSAPAIRDLRYCLEKTHQHGELVTTFQAALGTRLLHAGANTSEILDIYISIIKAFRILDPKGVLLEALSEPIKQYLRQRKDTVRCIVTNLTDDQNGELFEELRQNNLQLIQQDDDSDDDEELAPDTWEPDPIEANPKKTSRSRKSDDILRLLVNIYGSKELFVNEYRLMLADKLLHNLEYQTDREVQTLELLKLRFGEDSLQNCEIMVRDIEDSKRINTNLQQAIDATRKQQQKQKQNPPPRQDNKCIVDAAIVSQHFWPPFQSEEFALHPSTAAQIEEFKDRYHVLRNPRTLQWNTSLGSVQLSVEINGVEKDFTVSPFQATIIQFFDNQERWHVDELAGKMEISDDSLLRHAAFWINNGVLLLSSDRKVLTATTSFQEAGLASSAFGDTMETAVSSDAQAEEQLKILESYIVGMLTNAGSLSIHKIHNALSTLARTGVYPYDKTVSGLSVILLQLMEKGRLVSVGGEFQLPRPGSGNP